MINEASHEERVFRNVIEKIKENKGVLGGIAAFSVMSAFGYVRYGRKLVMEENDEEYVEREWRIRNASKVRLYDDSFRFSLYADLLNPNITSEDVIKQLASEVVFTPSETQYKETIRLACRLANAFSVAAKDDVRELLNDANARIGRGEPFSMKDLQKLYYVSVAILNDNSHYACIDPSFSDIKNSEWALFAKTNERIKNVLEERRYRNLQ